MNSDMNNMPPAGEEVKPVFLVSDLIKAQGELLKQTQLVMQQRFLLEQANDKINQQEQQLEEAAQILKLQHKALMASEKQRKDADEKLHTEQKKNQVLTEKLGSLQKCLLQSQSELSTALRSLSVDKTEFESRRLFGKSLARKLVSLVESFQRKLSARLEQQKSMKNELAALRNALNQTLASLALKKEKQAAEVTHSAQHELNKRKAPAAESFIENSQDQNTNQMETPATEIMKQEITPQIPNACNNTENERHISLIDVEDSEMLKQESGEMNDGKSLLRNKRRTGLIVKNPAFNAERSLRPRLQQKRKFAFCCPQCGFSNSSKMMLKSHLQGCGKQTDTTGEPCLMEVKLKIENVPNNKKKGSRCTSTKSIFLKLHT